MHQITFTPMRREAPVTASIAGDTLLIDGTAFDLGGTGHCPWLVGAPERTAGGWHLTLILPHGGEAPHATRFPEPVLLAGDGPIPMAPFGLTGGEEEPNG